MNTKFWDDNYIIDLDPIEKLLFLYFLTNPMTNICGIYEVPLRRIAFDTGIDREMVLKILERFAKDDKLQYVNGWLYIKNFVKHQILNPKTKIGIERAMQELPKEIQDRLSIDYPYSTHTLPQSELKLKHKHKHKLKHKEKIIHKFIKPTLEEVQNYCKERDNGIDPQKWLDHYTANGWKVGKNPMKDWKAAVRTWEKKKGGWD